MLLDAILLCDLVKSILANHEAKKCDLKGFPSFAKEWDLVTLQPS